MIEGISSGSLVKAIQSGNNLCYLMLWMCHVVLLLCQVKHENLSRKLDMPSHINLNAVLCWARPTDRDPLAGARPKIVREFRTE